MKTALRKTTTTKTRHSNSGNGDEVKEMDRFGNDVRGGCRGGAREAQPHLPLFLDQTETQRAEKNSFEAGPSP